MCPVRAFAIMWQLAVANDGVPSGFIFRKKVGRNGWSIIGSEGMVHIFLLRLQNEHSYSKFLVHRFIYGILSQQPLGCRN
jgi:hypothetical protein